MCSMFPVSQHLMLQLAVAVKSATMLQLPACICKQGLRSACVQGAKGGAGAASELVARPFSQMQWTLPPPAVSLTVSTAHGFGADSCTGLCRRPAAFKG